MVNKVGRGQLFKFNISKFLKTYKFFVFFSPYRAQVKETVVTFYICLLMQPPKV